jgi:hypothetical protein
MSDGDFSGTLEEFFLCVFDLFRISRFGFGISKWLIDLAHPFVSLAFHGRTERKA